MKGFFDREAVIICPESINYLQDRMNQLLASDAS
jgi:hypothetical protein